MAAMVMTAPVTVPRRLLGLIRAAQRHGKRRDGRADHADQHRDPVPDARQTQVGRHVMEFEGIARG